MGFTNGGNPTYAWNPSSTNTNHSCSCNIMLGRCELSCAISGFPFQVNFLKCGILALLPKLNILEIVVIYWWMHIELCESLDS